MSTEKLEIKTLYRRSRRYYKRQKPKLISLQFNSYTSATEGVLELTNMLLKAYKTFAIKAYCA